MFMRTLGWRADAVQIAHSNRFLILASSVPPVTAVDAAVLPNVPVHQLTTFHVVSHQGAWCRSWPNRHRI